MDFETGYRHATAQRTCDFRDLDFVPFSVFRTSVIFASLAVVVTSGTSKRSLHIGWNKTFSACAPKERR